MAKTFCNDREKKTALCKISRNKSTGSIKKLNIIIK